MARCPGTVASVLVSYVGQDICRYQKLNGAIYLVKFLVTSEKVTKTLVGETTPVLIRQTFFCFEKPFLSLEMRYIDASWRK
jgi:hypothetical protein